MENFNYFLKNKIKAMTKFTEVASQIKRVLRIENSALFSPIFLRRVLWSSFIFVGITYTMFQKKLLPLQISKIVSKMFFFPTFPFTVILRLGNYWTTIDDTLILGCAPMGFLGHPDDLYKIGVRGVVNMCYEYAGPKSHYERLGIKQLHLPTCDHFEPSVENMKEAVTFIQYHKERGEKVYLHCKAGHGRAASIALCWLMHENKDQDPKVSNCTVTHTSIKISL